MATAADRAGYNERSTTNGGGWINDGSARKTVSGQEWIWMNEDGRKFERMEKGPSLGP
ncbi:hypothetical protein B8V81_0746 [Paenibacillus pasadenensis]|uniref:Uncharacterized protein n=1 Tax=Paenibacillus pasadenensis TaxID=217090 RepID=A0A2N5NBV5_9BACL|nr:hypothetical protein B8V81_0746 [Paenibacillus pasadenensis]